MTKLFKISALASLSLGLPQLAHAQDFKGTVGGLTGFVESLIPVLTSLAVLLFIWGAVQYIFQAGNDAEVEAGKDRMLWGVIGLFVITAIWGIVSLIGGSLGLPTGL
jgi:hypothetical protein